MNEEATEESSKTVCETAYGEKVGKLSNSNSEESVPHDVPIKFEVAKDPHLND